MKNQARSTRRVQGLRECGRPRARGSHVDGRRDSRWARSSRDGAAGPAEDEPGLRHGPGRDAAGGPGPDHRLHSAADDRRRPWRGRAPVVGRVVLPAGRHDRDRPRRQVRRPVRSQAHLPDGRRPCSSSRRHVRAGHRNDLADRVAGGPGVRGRLLDGDRDGGDRRRHPAAGAGQVPGRARAPSSVSRPCSGRCSAACSPTTCRGGGSSTSTCRSASR